MMLQRMCSSTTLLPILAVLVLACSASKEQPAEAANKKDSQQSIADKRSWGHMDDKKSWGNFDAEKKSWGNFDDGDKRSWGSMEVDKKDSSNVAAVRPEDLMDKKSWGSMDVDKRGRYGSKSSSFFKKKSWGNPAWKRDYENRYGNQGMYGSNRFFKRSVDEDGAINSRERRSVDDDDNDNKRSWSSVNWEWLPKRRPAGKLNFFKRFDDDEDEKRGYGGSRNRANFFKRARFFKRGWGNVGSDRRGWSDFDDWDEKRRSLDNSEEGLKRSWGAFDFPQRRSWGNLDWPQVKKWGTAYKHLLEE